MSRLKESYQDKIIPFFLQEGYKNRMAVPKVTKVIVNVGIGKNRLIQHYKEKVAENIQAITGQKPAIRKAKKAIAGFKVKQGDEVGLMVTLRGEKMYDFLDKLANITLPRLRDFRGFDPKGFDKVGNYSLGVRENIIFPETSHEAGEPHGLQINIAIDAKSNKEAQILLEKLGFPFKKETNG